MLILNISVPNPCANHTCAEMCVLKAGGNSICLCSDGAVVKMNEACPLSEVIGHYTHNICMTSVAEASNLFSVKSKYPDSHLSLFITKRNSHYTCSLTLFITKKKENYAVTNVVHVCSEIYLLLF
jgi:hypothetical protein